jgi:hypothetical protein
VSRQNLADLVFSKTVTVEWHKQDRYQRILGKVLLDGKDVNLEQIKAGLAWHYKQYDRDQLPADRQFYAEAQKAASLKGIGMWSAIASLKRIMSSKCMLSDGESSPHRRRTLARRARYSAASWLMSKPLFCAQEAMCLRSGLGRATQYWRLAQ